MENKKIAVVMAVALVAVFAFAAFSMGVAFADGGSDDCACPVPSDPTACFVPLADGTCPEPDAGVIDR